MLKICYKYKYCVKIVNTSIDIFSMVKHRVLTFAANEKF